MPTVSMRRNAARELADMPPVAAAASRPARPAIGPAAEQARGRLVRAVLAIYLLAIFEGALRKYVAPQAGQYIFFIRDPLLVFVYLLASRFRLWPSNSGLFAVSVLMCVVGLLLFVLQAALGGLNDTRLLLGVYGWRSYCFYVPLAFLVGEQFKAADLARFAKITLWLTVPTALLVAAQFASPPGSAINVGIASEAELQFRSIGLDLERVRTTGWFTSSVGQQQFIGTACAVLLALVLMPGRQRPVGAIGLAVAAGAVLTCAGLSGSRGAVLQCAMSGVFAVSIGFIGRGAALRARAFALPAALAMASAVLYPLLFPIGFKTFAARWTSAAGNEAGIQGGVFGRALYGLVDFVHLIESVPALGYGLGYGGNASITLRATIDGVQPGLLAEDDFARHMVDIGPAFGLCYIAFRFAVVFWMMRWAVRATRGSSDPLPMLLFGYAGWVVLSGQITGHGTVNVYAWLFAGLCVAASREALAARSPHLAFFGAAGSSRRRRRLAERWPGRFPNRFPNRTTRPTTT